MNEKILVVDDEKEIADLLEVYLKNDNYTVYKYYSGIEALKCIEKSEKSFISPLLCLLLKLKTGIK